MQKILGILMPDRAGDYCNVIPFYLTDKRVLYYAKKDINCFPGLRIYRLWYLLVQQVFLWLLIYSAVDYDTQQETRSNGLPDDISVAMHHIVRYSYADLKL